MSRRPQHGVTLVELMIAIAIGLLILVAIAQVYMGSFNTQRTQDDMARLQETGRFAFNLIGRAVRQAGYRDTTEGLASFCSARSLGSGLAGLNDAEQIDPAASDFGGNAFTISNASDVIRVQYYGHSTEASPALLDCQGYPVAAKQPVKDTLFVASDPNNNNEPTLFCHTSNPEPVTASHPGASALVAGVESLQLLYSEDVDGAGTLRFVPWHLLTDPDKVSAVKVSIVARSPNAVTVDAAAKTFNHFSAAGTVAYPAAQNADAGAVFQAGADRRLRQMFSMDIALRNNYGTCEEY